MSLDLENLNTTTTTMPPVSRHLQCGITLYSYVKNVTRIRNWDKGNGIDVVLFLLLIFYYYCYCY